RSVPAISPSATKTGSFVPGTDGSNPFPSSGESGANFASSDKAERRCRPTASRPLTPAPHPVIGKPHWRTLASCGYRSTCRATHARLMRARQLGGEIKYLSQGKIEARNRGYSPYSVETWRTWEYCANKAGCGHLLTRPDGGQVHPPKG